MTGEHMQLLSAALQGFTVLAQNVTDVADGAFRAFVVNGYPAPSYSPVVCLERQLPQADTLEAVSAYWRQQWGPAYPPGFVFCPCDRTPPRHAADGWRRVEPLHIIVESSRPRRPQVRPPFTLSTVRLGDSVTDVQFQAVVAACFPETRQNPEQILAPFHRARALTELIIISHGDPPRPVAASAVTARGDTAFQTRGAVVKPYRGLGFSRVMQEAALGRCHALGATTAVTATRNPRVLGVNRPSLELWIYQYQPNDANDDF
ncbi:hypothetical protein AV521_02700 [Streptomyces sp. IMTB 2501]|uniref:hypothetical protein n=1 Tax=Streptomyces sp. IMTB 2501 TaxID=1776340 RepID=UPI00096DFE73|nr:hypothetical protein [Streptomyces sp. IMTB 2501]OLZ74560.1 hypothetical protein AV521_02700 [Streptomyces sp. IMTB 2501]